MLYLCTMYISICAKLYVYLNCAMHHQIQNIPSVSYMQVCRKGRERGKQAGLEFLVGPDISNTLVILVNFLNSCERSFSVPADDVYRH